MITGENNMTSEKHAFTDFNRGSSDYWQVNSGNQRIQLIEVLDTRKIHYAPART